MLCLIAEGIDLPAARAGAIDEKKSEGSTSYGASTGPARAPPLQSVNLPGADTYVPIEVARTCRIDAVDRARRRVARPPDLGHARHDTTHFHYSSYSLIQPVGFPGERKIPPSGPISLSRHV